MSPAYLLDVYLKMVLKIAAHARHVLHHGYSERLKT